VNLSDWIAAASLGVATAALAISVYAIGRANKTTSAATLVSLNEGFRQAWEKYLQGLAAGPDAAASYHLAELLNLLEIACAIYLEGSLSGNSRKLQVEYLDNALSLLTSTPSVDDQVLQLLQTERTFSFIKKFLRKVEKKPSVLSVTIPPKWYELKP
jgi:hypothetical protein